MDELPQRFWAALCLAPYLIGVPAYCIRWIVRRGRTQRSTALGWFYLVIWLGTLAAQIAYFLSGGWYRENTPADVNLIGLGVALLVYAGLPLVAIGHLRHARGSATAIESE